VWLGITTISAPTSLIAFSMTLMGSPRTTLPITSTPAASSSAVTVSTRFSAASSTRSANAPTRGPRSVCATVSIAETTWTVASYLSARLFACGIASFPFPPGATGRRMSSYIRDGPIAGCKTVPTVVAGKRYRSSR